MGLVGIGKNFRGYFKQALIISGARKVYEVGPAFRA